MPVFHGLMQRGQGLPGKGGADTDASGFRRGSPDWLLNRLTVSGPRAEVARFRAAARGTNAIPWHLDLDHEEVRLLAPMAGGGAEALALARHLREAIERRHDLVLARWQEPGGCPFDLNRLIPVPEPVLRLGEDAPAAVAWLQAHWGVTQPLRWARVLADGVDRRLRRKAEIVYEFRSADWTPWAAIHQLRLDWPQLVLHVRPRYDDV